MRYHEAKQLPETSASRQLEASDYSTDELAHQLHTSFYGLVGGAAAADFLSAWEALLWDRPMVCRALAHLGTDLRQINFRKS